MQRKYFGTDGIRGRVGTSPITPDFVLKLGWAAGRVLAKSKQGRGKVLIGKDTRISGYMFEAALEAGLSAAGVSSYLLGPMPTPAVAYLTRTLRAQAGIVISASHNGYKDNGIKFFSHEGIKLPDEIEYEIEQQIDQPLELVVSERLGKAKRIKDAPARYIEFCKSTFPSKKTLEGLKIIVDCANGATYHVAPCVFSELGAEVVELAVDPDGLNINEGCGATSPEMLQRIVKAEKADLGIALDGDGDRLIMVDHKGEVVDGDEIIYVIANFLKMNNQLHGGIVGTVMSNFGLEKAFQESSIDFIRSDVGDRYVMEALLKQNWILGGETSGHVILPEITTTGDGIVTALQVLNAMLEQKKTLHELKSSMKKFPQVIVNVKVKKKIDINDSASIQSGIKAAEAQLQDRGRVLLRPSGTEPVIRVMVEGDKEKEVNQIANDLAEIVKTAAE